MRIRDSAWRIPVTKNIAVYLPSTSLNESFVRRAIPNVRLMVAPAVYGSGMLNEWFVTSSKAFYVFLWNLWWIHCKIWIRYEFSIRWNLWSCKTILNLFLNLWKNTDTNLNEFLEKSLKLNRVIFRAFLAKLFRDFW